MSTEKEARDAGWSPTHKITFAQGKTARDYRVMLDEDGSAYTAGEYLAGEGSDWSVTNGVWTCQGQATPGGANGDVTIKRLRKT